jgi:hypothetical protein
VDGKLEHDELRYRHLVVAILAKIRWSSFNCATATFAKLMEPCLANLATGSSGVRVSLMVSSIASAPLRGMQWMAELVAPMKCKRHVHVQQLTKTAWCPLGPCGMFVMLAVVVASINGTARLSTIRKWVASSAKLISP